MEREEKKQKKKKQVLEEKKEEKQQRHAPSVGCILTVHSEIQKAVNSTAEETQKMLLSNDVLTEMREMKVGMDAESLPFYFDLAEKKTGI